MKKKKSLILKIVSLVMMCCMSFLFVGCLGDEPSDDTMLGGSYDPNQPGGEESLPENLMFDMYGTKVLYRPDSYDYNIGSGGTEENPNDYYGKYAYVILQDLVNIYGVVNTETLSARLPDNTININYLYDSIRYNVSITGSVNEEYLVGADYTQRWNWSFEYNNSEVPALLLHIHFQSLIPLKYVWPEYSPFREAGYTQS